MLRLTDGQLLTAIWRWHSELLHTHNPKTAARIRQIILALEGLPSHRQGELGRSVAL